MMKKIDDLQDLPVSAKSTVTVKREGLKNSSSSKSSSSKEKELQNPKDKREILCDEVLMRIFKRGKITMFSMNKFLAPVSQ